MKPTVPRWAWCVLGALVVLKLVLVSHDEVLSYGVDTAQCVKAAAAWYWGQPYGETSYVRQPVFPLFLAASSALGVPARLAIEAVWVAACVIMLAALRSCGVGAAGSLTAAILTLFHPSSIFVFFRLIQDALYAPAFVALVCSVAAAAVARDRRGLWAWGSIAAVACAIAANTRLESITLVPILAVASVLILLARRAGRATWAPTLGRLGAAVVAPFLGWQALTHAICIANHRAIGMYATCDLGSQGFRSLYGTLLAIPTDNPDPALPIKKDVRERAYAVSPTFALLRPWLENPTVNPIVRYEARAAGEGDDREHGADSTWAIRRAAWRYRTDWPSARALDEFYREAAGELRAAMARGELGRRRVPLSLIPPEWDVLVKRELPRALGRCVSVLMRPWAGPAPRDRERPARGLFEAVSVRRVVPGAMRSGVMPEGSAWHSREAARRIGAWRGRLERAYGDLMVAGLVVLVAGLVVAPIAAVKGWGNRDALALAAILATALVTRMAFVVLLDATGVPPQARYVLPAAGAGVALAVVSATGLAAVVAGAVRGRLKRPVSAGE